MGVTGASNTLFVRVAVWAKLAVSASAITTPVRILIVALQILRVFILFPRCCLLDEIGFMERPNTGSPLWRNGSCPTTSDTRVSQFLADDGERRSERGSEAEASAEANAEAKAK